MRLKDERNEEIETGKKKAKKFLKCCAVEFTSDGQTYRGICRNLSFDGLF